MKRIRYLVVGGLEYVCTALDHLPWFFYDREDGLQFSRHGCIGCVIGFSRWSSRLEDRWETGWWTSAGDTRPDSPTVEGSGP